ncbi:hypothetical protein TNIN_48691 [Trichonephila inaurata madagascariensis]|uniref:Uncharacterized protein n=1 Tax=Trichonephila inaurata madagascariensis TaxID=2747483 RepID=A0A8X6X4Q9_9ARAC|nr:hypothetical protein TNIN_48691 [Trichonephila inaurata madagascariensis]
MLTVSLNESQLAFCKVPKFIPTDDYKMSFAKFYEDGRMITSNVIQYGPGALKKNNDLSNRNIKCLRSVIAEGRVGMGSIF